MFSDPSQGWSLAFANPEDISGLTTIIPCTYSCSEHIFRKTANLDVNDLPRIGLQLLSFGCSIKFCQQFCWPISLERSRSSFKIQLLSKQLVVRVYVKYLRRPNLWEHCCLNDSKSVHDFNIVLRGQQGFWFHFGQQKALRGSSNGRSSSVSSVSPILISDGEWNFLKITCTPAKKIACWRAYMKFVGEVILVLWWAR